MDSSSILSCLSNINKTEEDIRVAHAWFKRNTDAFKDLSIETMTDILKSAKIVEKYPNEIIIRQGDIGDCFYVLLSGSASLYISNDALASVKDEQSEHSVVVSHAKLARSARSENAQKLKLDNKKLIKDGDRKNYGEFINNYNEGGCFGQLALMQEENIRNASIIADEKCHLLLISKDLFDKAIRASAELLYKEKINFVSSHVLFKNWQPKIRHQLAMSLEKLSFYFDQEIISQGRSSEGLFFIKKGTAKVVMDIKQHYQQYAAHLSQAEYGDGTLPENFAYSREDLKTARSGRENPKAIRRDKIEIAIIGSNDIIGDIEFGFSFPTNLLTVTAMEECEVYILENVHVERMISLKRNISTLEVLQHLAELKMNTYYKRCAVFGELPLLRLLLTEISVENEMISLTEQVEKQSQKTSLLPIFKSGPIIDFYGPGSVFFRNRLKRKATLEGLSKAQREQQLQRKDIRPTMYSVQRSVSDLRNPIEALKGPKKSIFQSNQKKNTFRDWETSSVHLGDLENRMKTWMSTVESTQPVRSTKLSMDSSLLKLPRFQYDDLSDDCRFIIKYKRTHNEDVDDPESRITGRRDEDLNSNENNKKTNESLIRQYTELEYIKLKEEMRVKEKRLSIFRLKHAL